MHPRKDGTVEHPRTRADRLRATKMPDLARFVAHPKIQNEANGWRRARLERQHRKSKRTQSNPAKSVFSVSKCGKRRKMAPPYYETNPTKQSS
jgi:hypothetical protein